MKAPELLTFPELFQAAILPPLGLGRVVERVLLGPDAQALYDHHKMCNKLLMVEQLPPFMHSLEEEFCGQKMGRMKAPGIAIVTAKPKLVSLSFQEP